MNRLPVLTALLAAADGDFPPQDGQAVLMPALPGGLEAVVSFTGHALLATALPAVDFTDLRLDGVGAAVHPAVLLRMAGTRGLVGEIDATLVGRGLGGGGLPSSPWVSDPSAARCSSALRVGRPPDWTRPGDRRASDTHECHGRRALTIAQLRCDTRVLTLSTTRPASVTSATRWSRSWCTNQRSRRWASCGPRSGA